MWVTRSASHHPSDRVTPGAYRPSRAGDSRSESPTFNPTSHLLPDTIIRSLSPAACRSCQGGIVDRPVIVCGLGRVGWRILDHLRAANLPVAVVSLNDPA